MEIKKTAVAGTLESSDCMVTVEPAKKGIELELEGLAASEISTLRYGGSETRDYDLMIARWGSDYPDPRQPRGSVLPAGDRGQRAAV